MREKELRSRTICGICGKKFGHTGLPTFWTVTLERHMIDMNAVNRQDGLGQMLGHSALAQVMGADEEMTGTVFGPKTITVCETCSNEEVIIESIAADISEK